VYFSATSNMNQTCGLAGFGRDLGVVLVFDLLANQTSSGDWRAGKFP
jgi:hypothetical protein